MHKSEKLNDNKWLNGNIYNKHFKQEYNKTNNKKIKKFDNSHKALHSNQKPN